MDTGQFRRKHHGEATKASAAAVAEKVEKTEKLEKAGKAETVGNPVVVTYPDPTQDRKPAFQRAMEARQAMRPDGLLATEDYARLMPLQRALEMKARSLAEALPPPRNVKTVTYDFETGLRTSIYSDGSVAEEPFEFSDRVDQPAAALRRRQGYATRPTNGLRLCGQCRAVRSGCSFLSQINMERATRCYPV